MHVTISFPNFPERTHAKKSTFARTRPRRSVQPIGRGDIRTDLFAAGASAFTTWTRSGIVFFHELIATLGRLGTASNGGIHTVNDPHSAQKRASPS
jgi:hypothetical protein